MTLPNLSPQLGEDNKRGWTNLAENLRSLEKDAPSVATDLAELASRCETLASESYPCDLSVLEKRKKQARLERELAELA